MTYRIDRAALSDFLTRQLDMVERTVPRPAAEQLEPSDHASEQETRAVWLGAGLATHVGLAIFEEPEQFLTITTAGRGAA